MPGRSIPLWRNGKMKSGLSPRSLSCARCGSSDRLSFSLVLPLSALRVTPPHLACCYPSSRPTSTQAPSPCTHTPLHPAPCILTDINPSTYAPSTYTHIPLHPAPYTHLHPAFCTLHPTPCTLHPAPCNLHSAPYTLHSAPCTLHPAPYTLDPGP